MAVFLILASARNTKIFREIEQRQKEKEAKDRLHSRQRTEMHEKEQIDHLLRNSLREALVRE